MIDVPAADRRRLVGVGLKWNGPGGGREGMAFPEATPSPYFFKKARRG